jgi:hypothetical protein
MITLGKCDVFMVVFSAEHGQLPPRHHRCGWEFYHTWRCWWLLWIALLSISISSPCRDWSYSIGLGSVEFWSNSLLKCVKSISLLMEWYFQFQKKRGKHSGSLGNVLLNHVEVQKDTALVGQREVVCLPSQLSVSNYIGHRRRVLMCMNLFLIYL